MQRKNVGANNKVPQIIKLPKNLVIFGGHLRKQLLQGNN